MPTYVPADNSYNEVPGQRGVAVADWIDLSDNTLWDDAAPPDALVLTPEVALARKGMKGNQWLEFTHESAVGDVSVSGYGQPVAAGAWKKGIRIGLNWKLDGTVSISPAIVAAAGLVFCEDGSGIGTEGQDTRGIGWVLSSKLLDELAATTLKVVPFDDTGAANDPITTAWGIDEGGEYLGGSKLLDLWVGIDRAANGDMDMYAGPYGHGVPVKINQATVAAGSALAGVLAVCVQTATDAGDVTVITMMIGSPLHDYTVSGFPWEISG